MLAAIYGKCTFPSVLKGTHSHPKNLKERGHSCPLYLRDPDGNGVELYWDRPSEEWPRAEDGELAMFTRRLDLDRLAVEAGHSERYETETEFE